MNYRAIIFVMILSMPQVFFAQGIKIVDVKETVSGSDAFHAPIGRNGQKFLFCVGEALPRFAQQRPVFLMGVVADIELFLQGAERTFPTAVANIGRFCVSGTNILFEVRTLEITYAAPMTQSEVLR